ncbi:Fur family transcriptional regulator [Verrucosispora sioxanthis]|uniref:Transcriptional repressor n=1 Tax=Verrucosispora sioxanthis TaxID=2499994 RepID=A0A6M1L4W9_9ACTN|nr:transcriptional repressor [Verrucosispora sioxanthis]NEE64460.1 transcriptional repressor [Verrucosispora sioxanthis]NGM13570.1 transcriptional repressor [Verrucosispora sioxanthis]
MITTEADRVDTALRRLRRAGMRNTVARRGILALLAHAAGDRGHLTATQLHEALLARGLAMEMSTVHRILRQLIDLGIAHTVPVAGAMTFGLADQPHHHAVCEGCGSLRQLPAAAVAASIDAARTAGIEVDPDGYPSGVVLYGRCAQCRMTTAD